MTLGRVSKVSRLITSKYSCSLIEFFSISYYFQIFTCHYIWLNWLSNHQLFKDHLNDFLTLDAKGLILVSEDRVWFTGLRILIFITQHVRTHKFSFHHILLISFGKKKILKFLLKISIFLKKNVISLELA